MAEDLSTPRVNSARLSEVIGRTVRFICKVERVRGPTAIVRATDRGQVEIKLPMGGELQEGKYVEIIGTVEEPNVINLKGYVDLGPNELDMQLIDDCIEMINNPKYETIF
ncbi:replication factor A 3 [Pyrrhoderma noxium]|uniref:Replication factor A 3 n=1 Tax=Pyrrhoderma noxium TaxID=2282107 RepID=A0A286U6S0_9AGAM|nr:replication factor A 3 [Pyrrhoderma noxium]